MVDGPAAGTQIPLAGEQDFGQKAGELGTLGNDQRLAAHHARISRGPTGELVFYDVGARGGTYLNGKRVSNAVVLTTGDRIQIGDTTLELAGPAMPEPVASEPVLSEAYRELTGETAAEIPVTQEPLQGLLGGTVLSRFAPTISAHLPPTLKGRIFPAVAGLVVQLLVGWEWIISGATKIKNGDFPGGLANSIRMTDGQAASWYKSFLNSVMIPHAKLFGYLIESAELLIGVVIFGTGLLWLWRWEHLRSSTREWLLVGTIVTCMLGVLMNIGFFLMSGANLPVFLAKDSFGEGVGLDLVLPYLETIIVAVSLWTLLSIRRTRAAQLASQGGAVRAAEVPGSPVAPEAQ